MKPRKVVALNFPPKGHTLPLDVVVGNNLYTEDIYEDESLQDSVFMSSKSYSSIFGESRSESNCYKRRLAVVRIKSITTHKSIYRKYVFSPKYEGLDDNNLALHPSSIRELGNNNEIVGSDVIVSPGSALLYYWRHPFHATRISTKLGVCSIILGILSIILTIVMSCCC